MRECCVYRDPTTSPGDNPSCLVGLQFFLSLLRFLVTAVFASWDGGAFHFTVEQNRGVLLGTLLREQVPDQHFWKVPLWPDAHRPKDGVIAEKWFWCLSPALLHTAWSRGCSLWRWADSVCPWTTRVSCQWHPKTVWQFARLRVSKLKSFFIKNKGPEWKEISIYEGNCNKDELSCFILEN